MKNFAILFVIAILISACAPVATPTPTAAGVRLRVINLGPVDIKDLVVLFPDSEISFGDVPAGTTSEYQPAPNGVYNYAAYRYMRDGQEVTQPVIDWVGENARPGTKFTYVIEYDPTRPQMQAIQLIEFREP